MGRLRHVRQHLLPYRSALSGVWAALRDTPWLNVLAAALGVAASLAVAWHLGDVYRGPAGTPTQMAMAQSPHGVQEFAHFFLENWLRWTIVLLAPAFGLALIRSRGSEFLLPIGLASIVLLIYWLQGDVYDHYETTRISNLGEPPSNPAYYGKLLVTSLALLSPVVMVAFYMKGTVLDRYLVRTFLTPFCLCFFGLMSLFIFFDFYDNGKDLLEAKFRTRQVLEFYAVQVPKFLVEIIDISLLLAVLSSLGRLSRHNEIISMVSAGRSVPRILLPLFIIGGFAAIVTLACNYQWAPEADRKKSDLLRLAEDIDQGRRVQKIRTSAERVTYMNRSDRRLWFLQNVPIDLGPGNPISGVELHEMNDDGSVKYSIYAKKATWMAVDPPLWTFNQVRLMRHNPDPLLYEDRQLARLAIPGWSETPWKLLSESAKLPAQFLTVPQLASYLQTNRDFPEFRLASYRTWWHDRLARPLRCLIVVLFAAPLGIVFSRRGLMGSVGTTILLYFSMYFLSSIFIRLGETYKLPALSAAWMVNIVFGLVGIFLLWQRSTHADAFSLLRRLGSRKKA